MEANLSDPPPGTFDNLDTDSGYNNSVVVLPNQRNSQGQTAMVASVIAVSVIVAILVSVIAVLVRRKVQKRKLREKRAREVVDMCVDRAKFGVLRAPLRDS